MAEAKTNRRQRSTKQVLVSLVSMPFKDLRHPPIQLGILESCLIQAGVTVRSHSFELAFMEYLHKQSSKSLNSERITISNYLHVACQNFVVNLGDWIFQVAPYADSLTNDEDYLKFIRESGITEEEIAMAIRMKSLVPGFLNLVADELLAGKPRIVGFSSVFQQNVASLVLAKILKQRDPSLMIVFGGGNCDGPMGASLHDNFPWVDIVVRGEGERVFVEVVSDILAGRPIRPQPGLCFRDGAKAIVIPQGGEPQVLMMDVPRPTYDEYFERLDHSSLRNELRPDVAILFESSRGCWWGAKSHCTFCGLNGTLMKFRSKSPERVLEEILYFANRYKILDFVAVDDIIDLGHIRELMPKLKAADCDLQIFYETKSNLKKEQLHTLYSGGVNAIQPGIESLSTPILLLMKKGVTALQNIRLLKWCAEIGITPAWNILYGFPGEPAAEYERMAKLIPSLIHLEPPSIMPVQLQRFSPYFDHPSEHGIEIIGPQQQYKSLYPISEGALVDLAYDFDFRFKDDRDPETYVGKLKDTVKTWRHLNKDDRGFLHYRKGPDFIIVEDRRAGFEQADYQFDGIEGKIYLACDGGATTDQLFGMISKDNNEIIEKDELEAYLDELVEAGLMYREGNRFLSLAIAINGISKFQPKEEHIHEASHS